MPALDPELKKAIGRMPETEKDKLLLRLIAKDPTLTEKLQFELVEERSTVDERRQIIREYTDRVARLYQDTPGWVMMDMRSVSGYITRHMKVTKDAYGEVDLSVHMINTFYEHHFDQLRFYDRRSDKAAQYIAKRADQILKKLYKLDPDYYLEFENDVNKMLTNVYKSCAQHYARQLDLPHSWSA
ncbi:MAG: hypothetical protein H7Z72_14125 [Bacteroidetes bacterium]|nr:hypothetical protein [Fibrella sp.]